MGEQEGPITVGAWIKKRRSDARLSLRKLADMAGIAHSSLDKIEHGGGVRRDTLEMIVSALAGPDADEHARERLRQEAMAASVGIELAGVEDMAAPAEPRYIEDNNGHRWRVVMELGEAQMSPDLARILAALDYLEPEEHQ